MSKFIEDKPVTSTYTIRINEVAEGENVSPLLLECKFGANSDQAADEIMSDLLLSVIKHNHLALENVNANLYKTQWVNGI